MGDDKLKENFSWQTWREEVTCETVTDGTTVLELPVKNDFKVLRRQSSQQLMTDK
jgi:hypothetical protein